MDIDALASEFGSAGTSPTASTTVDINALASEFGSGSKDAAKEPTRITIRPKDYNSIPKPPISGISKESSDELNATRAERNDTINPRALLPKTDIQNKAYEADLAGKQMFNEGVTDLQSGSPYKGAAKVVGGGLSRAMSPVTGIIEGGVNTLVTDITGNPDIGDRASIIAGAALPLDMGLNAANKVAGGLPYLNKISTYSKNKALSGLIENIGQENLPAVVSAMKANPRLAPADLSPQVLQGTQNLFVNDGPQIDYLARTSADRLAGSKGAVNTALDASMGASVNAAQKVEDLKKAAQAIGKQNIDPILKAKPHTDITGLIKHIDTEIGYPAMKAIKEGKQPPLPLTPYQRELLDVRNKLRNPQWPDRDKMFAYTDDLHDAQIKLRETAQGLSKSAAGSERNTGSDLLKFREKMKDAVGPEYKAALAKYAGQKKVEEAFHNGYDTILSNSKKLENDPSFFDKWVNSSARKPGELEAAREGARLRINAEIQGARTAATNPAAKAIGIGQTEFSVQRLQSLFGKEETNKLLTNLEHERMIANTHNKVIEGSNTSKAAASKAQFALPTKTEVMRSAPAIAASEASNYFLGGYPGFGSAMLGGAKVGAMVKDMIALKLAKEHNIHYAKYALPTQGPSRDELIRQLEARIPGPKQSMMRRGANAISRVIAP